MSGIDTYGYLMDVESLYFDQKAHLESWRDDIENPTPQKERNKLKEVNAELRKIRECMKWVKKQKD